MATAIEQWGSLLSVPMGRIRPHFWSFSAAAVLHLVFNIYANLTAAGVGACRRWQDLPSAIVADTISANLFWLVYSPILVEVVYMVIAAIFLNKKQKESRQEGHQEGRQEGHQEGHQEGREEGLEEGRAKGREEGRQEGRQQGIDEGRQQGIDEGRQQGIDQGLTRADQAWREWNLRRMEAALNGVPFTDPPPDFTNGNGHRNGQTG